MHSDCSKSGIYRTKKPWHTTVIERHSLAEIAMPFDAAHYPASRPTPTSALIDAAGEPCPVWSALNPDRALALLFVAPRDCVAVDVLVAL